MMVFTRWMVMSFALCAVALVIGCGGGDKPAQNNSNNNANNNASTVDPAIKSKLVGQWSGSDMSGQITLELDMQADGKLQTMTTASGQTQQTTGTWEVAATTANQATVETIEEMKIHQMVFTLDNDFLSGSGGFSMALPNKQGDIHFKRKGP